MPRALFALLLCVALPALPVLAKDKGNPGKGKGNAKGPPAHAGKSGDDRDERRDDDDRDRHEYDHREYDRHEGDRHESDRDEWERDRRRDDWRRFSDDERRWWRDYWQDQYGRGHCPPGLAKKRNGCLPPGQAKKRYAVGRRLPSDVVLVPVPEYLLGRLPPLESGYRYGMVDGDLVKLAVGTSLVVDAIDGMLR